MRTYSRSIKHLPLRRTFGQTSCFSSTYTDMSLNQYTCMFEQIGKITVPCNEEYDFALKVEMQIEIR